MCNALPCLAHGRKRLCHPGPLCRRLRAAAPTAPPSSTPPRRGLRGVQATAGLRPRGRTWTPVCAAARGPVRAAADTAPSLDCPRAPLGCQATFWPPVGSVTRSSRCCALSHRATPQGAPRAPACGLLPSLPHPALAPQTALWGWRAGSSCAWHHTGASSSTADGTADPRGGSPHQPGGSRFRHTAWVQAAGALTTGQAATSGVHGAALRWPGGRPPRAGSHQERDPLSWQASGLVDLGSRHCACRQGTLVPGGAGVRWHAVWWRRAPTPPVGRCAPW
jgi:hypothetical protein